MVPAVSSAYAAGIGIIGGVILCALCVCVVIACLRRWPVERWRKEKKAPPEAPEAVVIDALDAAPEPPPTPPPAAEGGIASAAQAPSTLQVDELPPLPPGLGALSKTAVRPVATPARSKVPLLALGSQPQPQDGLGRASAAAAVPATSFLSPFFAVKTDSGEGSESDGEGERSSVAEGSGSGGEPVALESSSAGLGVTLKQPAALPPAVDPQQQLAGPPEATVPTATPLLDAGASSRRKALPTFRRVRGRVNWLRVAMRLTQASGDATAAAEEEAAYSPSSSRAAPAFAVSGLPGSTRRSPALSPPTEAFSAAFARAFATARLPSPAGSDVSQASSRRHPLSRSQTMGPRSHAAQESDWPASGGDASRHRHIVASILPGEALQDLTAEPAAPPPKGSARLPSSTRGRGLSTPKQQQQQRGGAMTVRVQASASPLPLRQAASMYPYMLLARSGSTGSGRGGSGATEWGLASPAGGGTVTPGGVRLGMSQTSRSRPFDDSRAVSFSASQPGAIDFLDGGAAEGRWDAPGSRISIAESLRAAPPIEPLSRSRGARGAPEPSSPRAPAVEAWGSLSPRAPPPQHEGPPAWEASPRAAAGTATRTTARRALPLTSPAMQRLGDAPPPPFFFETRQQPSRSPPGTEGRGAGRRFVSALHADHVADEDVAPAEELSEAQPTAAGAAPPYFQTSGVMPSPHRRAGGVQQEDAWDSASPLAQSGGTARLPVAAREQRSGGTGTRSNRGAATSRV